MREEDGREEIEAIKASWGPTQRRLRRSDGKEGGATAKKSKTAKKGEEEYVRTYRGGRGGKNPPAASPFPN